MNLLDTPEIPSFPDDIHIGWDTHRSDIDPEILTPEELKRYDSFSNPQRRSEFLTGRYIFQNLCKKLNWDPEKLALKHEPLGKPYVEGSMGRGFVSFSHSRDLVMCAVSPGKDIGLDIETLDREVNPQVVRRILSENEWRILGEQDPIRLWTMKEAAVKSIGTGLRTSLKELEMRKDSNGQFMITINDNQQLQGFSFEALNHCIALAY